MRQVCMDVMMVLLKFLSLVIGSDVEIVNVIKHQ